MPCIPGQQKSSNFGYPAIIDIADETKPRVVSTLKTEVMDPKNCAAVLADGAFIQSPDKFLKAGDVFPLIGSRVFLYDSHYCSTDRLHDPTIVACSSFASGVRVYDIRDPGKPAEIAYWNSGFVKDPVGSALYGNLAVARPVIRSDLGQIWFPDAFKGFHALQFRDGVWPFADRDPCPHVDYYLEQYDLGYRDCRAQRTATVRLPSQRPCRTTRDLTIRLRGEFASVRVYVRGKRVATRRRGTRLIVRGPGTGRYTLRIVARTHGGRTVTKTRRYRTCVPTGKARPRAATNPVLSAAVLDQVIALCRLMGQRAS